MKKTILKLMIVFAVMWCGLLGVKLWQPFRDTLSAPQKVARYTEELSRLGVEYTKANVNLEKAERELLAVEVALKYRLDLLEQASRMVKLWDWVFNTHFPEAFKRIADGGVLDIMDNIKKLDFSDEQCFKDLRERYQAADKYGYSNLLKEKDVAERTVKERKDKLAAIDAEMKRVKENINILKGGIRKVCWEHLLYGWKPALFLTVVFFSLDIVRKLLLFYVWAPLVERRATPVSLPQSDAACWQKQMFLPESVKLITCEIPVGEAFMLKSEEYSGGYTDMVNSNGLKKITQFLYSRKCWLMSVMCGLSILTRFHNKGNVAQSVRITSSDPDEYFCELKLTEGTRYFISPSELVAFSSGVRISAFNRFNSVAAWAMGQVRYYVLEGTGSVVIRSFGGITRIPADETLRFVQKKHSIISAVGKLSLRATRTETLIPYLLGESSLFDHQVSGVGVYFIRNTLRSPRSLSERFSNVFFTSLGKFLGF